MANNPNPSKPKDDVLYAQDVTFNMMNVAPVSATFKITKHEAEEKILQMARNYGDFKYVTFIIKPETGEISLIAWINKRSSDISDRSLIDNPSVYVNAAIDHDSQRMAEFKNMYAETSPDGRRVRYIQSATKSDFVGIRLNIAKVFTRFFDGSGRAYQKKMEESGVAKPGSAARECHVHLSVTHYNEGREPVFVITKTRKNLHGDEPPVPKPTFRG